MKLDDLKLPPRFAAHPPPWRSLLGPAGVIAIISFVIYTLGACRTIYVGDSGELVAAAATFGIPHPSGYPLYVLLGKVWITLVPVGSVAFRMSLMSAFFGALAVAGLFVLCRRTALSIPASLFGAASLAVLPSFWSQATVQRVYTLNAFFAVAVTLLAVEWLRTRDVRFMAGAAFVAGLGACNHTVIGIYAVAVGLVAIATEPSFLTRPKHLAACVGAGVAGLLPYAYLPLRSRQEPRLDWGDPDTFDAFIAVITRRDFWNRAWNEKPSDWLIIFNDFAKSLGDETLWIGLGLAILGAVLGFRRGWPVPLALAGMAANFWAVGAHGSRSDIFIWHRYYLVAYVLLVFLAAMGVHWIGERLRQSAKDLVYLLLAAPAVLLVLGWPLYDRSDFRIADDFSRTLLESLPPGAHLAASDDNILFVLIYLHLVEGLRPDVNLIMQGVGGADLPALRFDPDSDPLYFTHHPNWNHPQIDVVPVGLAFKTVRRGGDPEELVIPKTELVGGSDPRVPKDYLASNLTGHFHYMLGISHEQRDWLTASRELELAAEIAHRNDVLHYNLGLIYRRNGLIERALDAFKRSHRINPRRLASDKPAQAEDRIAETLEELEEKRRVEAHISADPSIADLEPGNAAWHRAVARLLSSRSEGRWARGHELIALELSAEEGR
ncbi:MAG: DUF2723 domain-containing protein [Acidobacteriota bacterium]